jgi:glycopeptide antibiotics resistance protein
MTTEDPSRALPAPPRPLSPSRRRLARAALLAHAALFLWLTLGVLPTARPVHNFRPFRSMAHDWSKGGHELLVNFLGNIVVFVPFGALLPLARRRPVSARETALAASAFSGVVEAMQYASSRRVADIDDVLLNGLGALIGYLGLQAWRRCR